MWSISELEENSHLQNNASEYTSQYPVKLGVGVVSLTFLLVFLLLERLRVQAQFRLLSKPTPLRDRVVALEGKLTTLLLKLLKLKI